MIDRFGPGIVGADGTIDRPKAGRPGLRPPRGPGRPQRHHPPGHRGRDDRPQGPASPGPTTIVVLDIPLLKPVHRELLRLAAVVVVDAPTELALERLVDQRGMAPERRRGPDRLPDRPGRPAGGRRPGHRQLRRPGPPGRPRSTGSWAALVALRPGRAPRARPRPAPPDGRAPDRGADVTPARYHRSHARLRGRLALPPGRRPAPGHRRPGGGPRAAATATRRCSGITGSGKTATIAWTIEAVQRPTLIIEPNKSLAAQLAAELKEFFPRNRVEYFVSYYDYYQPEAYVPSSDTYIEKDSSINDEIDRLRHACTSSLLLRPDTIVVASVSCIYGLGPPTSTATGSSPSTPARCTTSGRCSAGWSTCSTPATTSTLSRGQFRARGDTVEIHAAYESQAVRIEFFGDTVERIRPFDVTDRRDRRRPRGAGGLRQHPLRHRRRADAPGRRGHRGRAAGAAGRARRRPASCSRPSGCGCGPSTTSRCWPRPGCAAGSRTTAATSTAGRRARRPSPCSTSSPRTSWWSWTRATWPCPSSGASTPATAPARRPWSTTGSACRRPWTTGPSASRSSSSGPARSILLSATPGPWELEHSANVVEQVIRPTGLVDPEVDIRPTTGQIDDLRERIDATVADGLPGAGHHPDQEDGRGPDRLPGRAGRPGPVPPLRRRHHGPDRAPAGPPARGRSTCWWASTSSARASTCPRWRWWPSSTPTRRGSCAPPRR